MATIEIFQPGKTTEDEPTIKEKIEIAGIDPLRITPVNDDSRQPDSDD